MTHRMHILLDERRHALLRTRAQECGTSVGAVIREAIDHALFDGDERRAGAGRAFLAAEAMTVADWPSIEEEINAMYESAPRDAA